MQKIITLTIPLLFFIHLFSQNINVENYFNLQINDKERDSLRLLLNEYNSRLQDDSLNIELLQKRAEVYFHLGLKHKATSDYTALIKLDSLNPVYYYNRAICYAKYGYNILSCKDLYKSLSLGFEPAKNLYYSKCGLYFNTIEKRK